MIYFEVLPPSFRASLYHASGAHQYRCGFMFIGDRAATMMRRGLGFGLRFHYTLATATRAYPLPYFAVEGQP